MSWGHILFGFSGRLNRAKWWLSVLLLVILTIVVSIVSEVPAIKSVAALAIAINLVYFVVYMWISLATGAKRLHDLNRTGAWLVFFIGAPFLLTIIFVAIALASVGTAALSGAESLSEADIVRMMGSLGGILAIYGLIMLGIIIWSLVWFGCLRGTVGANQYGPDPLEGKI